MVSNLFNTCLCIKVFKKCFCNTLKMDSIEQVLIGLSCLSTFLVYHSRGSITFESSSQVFNSEWGMFSVEKTVHLQPTQDSCDECLINFKIIASQVFFRRGNVQLHLDSNWIMRIHIFVIVEHSMNHACDGISVMRVPCMVYWSNWSFNWLESIQWSRGTFDLWGRHQLHSAWILCLCYTFNRYRPIKYPLCVRVIWVYCWKSSSFKSLNFIQLMICHSSSLTGWPEDIVWLHLKI